MRTHACADDEVSKELFPSISPRGLFNTARDDLSGVSLLILHNLCVQINLQMMRFQRNYYRVRPVPGFECRSVPFKTFSRYWFTSAHKCEDPLH